LATESRRSGPDTGPCRGGHGGGGGDRPEAGARVLAAVAEHALDLFGEVDADGRLLFVSPNVRDVLGTPPEAFVGTRIRDWVHPDDLHTLRTGLADRFRSLEPNRIHYRFRDARSDTWRWFEVIGCPYRTAEGESRMVFVSRDVTERRELEAELRRRRREERRRAELEHVLVQLGRRVAHGRRPVAERLRSTARAAAEALRTERVGIWRLDEEGRVLRCLALFERSSGHFREAAPLRAGDLPAYFAALSSQRVVDADRALTDPRTRELADGYLRPLGISSILDASVRLEGRPGGVVCHEHVGPPRSWLPEERAFASAVADFVAVSLEAERRREAEERREALLAELEARNAEMERFTYTVSHDLKGPLVTVRGFTGLLRQDLERGDRTRSTTDLEEVERAVDRMGGLLDHLLALSRAGRVVRPPEDLGLEDVVREAAENLASTLEARGVELVVPDSSTRACVDRARMTEVFQNLLDNAVKFMGDQPQPRIEVEVSRQEGGLTCRVRDNGSGLPERGREQLFDLFTRGRDDVEGSGVGLALAKRIVEAHGGRIALEPGPGGRGAQAVLWLPEPADPGAAEAAS